MVAPELTSRRAVEETLSRFRLRPDRKLGQNFLIDAAALEKVVAAAELTPDAVVLEIGAGLGTLTRRLADASARVVAVEYDRRLEPALRESLADRPKVEVIIGDILGLDLGRMMGEAPFSVVSNIPYQITSHLIRRLLESPRRPDRIVLTVQREIAERIVAPPGGMSLLALGVRAYGEPRIAGHIEAGAFYPAPRVSSSVLRIDVHRPPRMTPEEARSVFRVARAGFSQPRKKLRNSVAAGMRVSPQVTEALLIEARISPADRAEDLGLEDWERLARIWPDL